MESILENTGKKNIRVYELTERLFMQVTKPSSAALPADVNQCLLASADQRSHIRSVRVAEDEKVEPSFYKYIIL